MAGEPVFSQPVKAGLSVTGGGAPAARPTGEKHSQQEASDVCPPCNSSGAGLTLHAQRTDSAQELHEKPESDENQGGNARGEPDNKKRDQRQDARAWKKDDIGAQNAGDRAARAKRRHPRPPREGQLGKAGTKSADKVKDEIGNRSHAILDVASKYPEKPHVAENMEEARVKEHARE